MLRALDWGVDASLRECAACVFLNLSPQYLKLAPPPTPPPISGYYPSGFSTLTDSFSPSAALMKAVLINSATPLALDDIASYLNISTAPLPQQLAQAGFGVPNLVRGLSFGNLGPSLRSYGLLPTMLLPGLTLSVNVSNAEPAGTFLSVDPSISDGESLQFCLDVTQQDAALAQNVSLPLSVTLVWSDPPGSPAAAYALVNDLDLELTLPDGVTVLLGNNDAAATQQLLDSRNNVEKLWLPVPNPTLSVVGTAAAVRVAPSYSLVVRGRNVPLGPQAFSLVAVGGGLVLGAPGTCGTVPGAATSAATVPLVTLEAVAASLGGALLISCVLLASNFVRSRKMKAAGGVPEVVHWVKPPAPVAIAAAAADTARVEKRTFPSALDSLPQHTKDALIANAHAPGEGKAGV